MLPCSMLGHGRIPLLLSCSLSTIRLHRKKIKEKTLVTLTLSVMVGIERAGNRNHDINHDIGSGDKARDRWYDTHHRDRLWLSIKI